MTATAHDIDILARTVFGEARGESDSGQLAVAFVAINRARIAAMTGREQFGDGTIAGACLAPWQFSCWLENDPNRPLLESVTLDDPAFQRAYHAALSAILGTEADPTAGATGYWAASIPTPAWAEGKPYLSIGRHRFIADA